MVFLRACYLVVLSALLSSLDGRAQQIYIPQQASELLKNTAADLATLLNSAVTSGNFVVATYNSLPATGIVLVYDTTISDNGKCLVSGNGTDKLTFTAAEDNGLTGGVYWYLGELGFKFYQPGSLWSVTPTLPTAFKNTQYIYNSSFKYQSWFISGGCRLWLMDNSSQYNWEGSYIGANGHEWSLYMRRNGMGGKHRFAGHRSDAYTGGYLDSLRNNPCYVASFYGNRQASIASVPDIFSEPSKNLWAGSIEKIYTNRKNIIFNNPVVYKNLFRSFRYGQLIGIEVADGPRWGAGFDSAGCNPGSYPSAADQSAILANNTAAIIKRTYPQQQFQVYAYYSHANVPSANIVIDENIDVQVPAVYQQESSYKGLMKRWYTRHANVSEYHYLNLPAWSGETPAYNLKEFRETARRLKQQNSQGIVLEASPAKFASIPVLYSLNNYLQNNADMDTSMKTFCRQMFGNAFNPVYKFITELGSGQVMATGRHMKYRFNYFLQLLAEAERLNSAQDPKIQSRLNELKAYLHYWILYSDYLVNEKDTEAQKLTKAGAICIYLAKTNKMLLVNSYYVINTIVARHRTNAAFAASYNTISGTAYQSGNLALISSQEIENNYRLDLERYAKNLAYHFLSAKEITPPIEAGVPGFNPSKKIHVKVNYTQGASYYGRTDLSFFSAKAGSFSFDYTADFGMENAGQVSFTVENADSALEVIQDVIIAAPNAKGTITVSIPKKGYYLFSVVSKFKTTVQLEIHTGNAVFYRTGTNGISESYSPTTTGNPSYFYVPPGLDKIYCSATNLFNRNTKQYYGAAEFNRQYIFRDQDGKVIAATMEPSVDSMLFFLRVPAASSGKFWQVTSLNLRNQFAFANISNLFWFGHQQCKEADFTVKLQKTGDECPIELNAKNFDGNNNWEIYDNGRFLSYSNTRKILLPVYISPGAAITQYRQQGCYTTQKLSEIEGFTKLMENCAAGAQVAEPELRLYPNPSRGTYSLFENNMAGVAQVIEIFDMYGKKLRIFKNTGKLTMPELVPAIYFYHIEKDGRDFYGKLVKL